MIIHQIVRVGLQALQIIRCQKRSLAPKYVLGRCSLHTFLLCEWNLWIQNADQQATRHQLLVSWSLTYFIAQQYFSSCLGVPQGKCRCKGTKVVSQKWHESSPEICTEYSSNHAVSGMYSFRSWRRTLLFWVWLCHKMGGIQKFLFSVEIVSVTKNQLGWIPESICLDFTIGSKYSSFKRLSIVSWPQSQALTQIERIEPATWHPFSPIHIIVLQRLQKDTCMLSCDVTLKYSACKTWWVGVFFDIFKV